MANTSAAIECFGLFRRRNDDGVGRLMQHFFDAYNVRPDYDNVKRFCELYDFFLRTLSPAERDAQRFDRLFCASFVSAERLAQRGVHQQSSPELQAVTALLKEEQSRRLAEERRRSCAVRPRRASGPRRTQPPSLWCSRTRPSSSHCRTGCRRNLPRRCETIFSAMPGFLPSP
jgi:hypothetical protein